MIHIIVSTISSAQYNKFVYQIQIKILTKKCILSLLTENLPCEDADCKDDCKDTERCNHETGDNPSEGKILSHQIVYRSDCLLVTND